MTQTMKIYVVFVHVVFSILLNVYFWSLKEMYLMHTAKVSSCRSENRAGSLLLKHGFSAVQCVVSIVSRYILNFYTSSL